ncbi:hypothetical protein [Methylobacterium nodulans]|uniref:Uncharacterized protein n=1 Tax=Methylobacterium nodulans (strain LMG 21967 / CNCM I-2342 / ORS 2060) TaxID=460265 RepID=B8IPD9_METNO|nr:hypothetical protein [Methylobacterium nodulans]ACL62231.1 conserved hypothetical protein [Methylobacterium nodulans ORS 2060]
MLYTDEIIDRKKGELVTISKGNWITVTELGQLYGAGPRQTRAILRQMDFLGVEGGGNHDRHRIQTWAVDRGFGRRIIPRAKGGYPFDVISPEGQKWIAEQWSTAVAALEAATSSPITEEAAIQLQLYETERERNKLTKLSVQAQVYWLCDHYKDLTHTDMASILSVSQQLVTRYAGCRSRQRRTRLERKAAEVPVLSNANRVDTRWDDFCDA